MKKNVILFLILIVLSVSNSFGQTSFGLHGGIDYGLGGKIRFGQPEISFEIGGGIVPILVFWTITGYFGSTDSYIKFYMSPSVGGALSFAVSNPGKSNQLNIKINGVYNILMGIGFGGGVDFLAKKGAKNVWLSGGIIYFPNAYDTLLEELIKDEHLINVSKDDISSVLVNIRPYIGVTFEL
ncbi:MAG: hypothetical protein FJW56_03765 [Actinobacteria bacterium]|nr:hypothetical protein [Actinomycetota bacterium]